jgi:hypothetical protein
VVKPSTRETFAQKKDPIRPTLVVIATAFTLAGVVASGAPARSTDRASGIVGNAQGR